MSTRRIKHADCQATKSIIVAGGPIPEGSKNWLGHDNDSGAAKVDFLLLEGACLALLEQDRPSPGLEGHLTHLEKEHGLGIHRWKVDGTKFYMFDRIQLGLTGSAFPDEVSNLDRVIQDGRVVRTLSMRYERDPRGREQCISHFGLDCAVCDLNFEQRYGELGRGYIHVHHLNPLATIKKSHVVNPKVELRPVCPNCHAMLHRGGKLSTIEELQRLLRGPIGKTQT